MLPADVRCAAAVARPQLHGRSCVAAVARPQLRGRSCAAAVPCERACRVCGPRPLPRRRESCRRQRKQMDGCV